MADNNQDITVEEIIETPEPTPEPKKDALTELKEAAAEGLLSIMKAGQSYKIGSRALTRADLKTLKGVYDDLLAQEEARNEENSDLLGGTVVGFFDRR